METKTVTEKELSSYIKATKKALVCKNAKTKQMLADLENDILCYCEENPNSTFEDIKKHFGEPNTVAEEFSIGFDDNYIKKYKFAQFFQNSSYCDINCYTPIYRYTNGCYRCQQPQNNCS